MHHIYHTNGFILSSKNVGEANKIFSIYTREKGLIKAMAQGVRLSKSKLKFSLQEFSYVRIDVVYGRDLWRITSAKIITSFPFVRSNSSSIILMARMSKLIERLCVGEESNEKIFDDVIHVLTILDNIDISPSTREAIELFVILRIMNALGYIGDSLLLKEYLSSPFSEKHIESLLKNKKSIVGHINKAFIESHL